jgi:hypothetical protein
LDLAAALAHRTMMVFVRSILDLLVFATLASLASCEVVDLTVANYDTKTEGKTVFIKLYPPWVR